MQRAQDGPRDVKARNSPLDGRPFFTISSRPPSGIPMRLLSKTLWIVAFVAASFCWMVLFEHGFSVQGFTKGVKEEMDALVSLVNRSEKK